MSEEPVRLSKFVLEGGPWNGFWGGGCLSSQCTDDSGYCPRVPHVLQWEGLKGGRYVYDDSSVSSEGPFESWVHGFRWETSQ